MALFTAIERESIKDFFVKLTQNNDNNLSLILVGSGATGFTDELSELDFYVVIDADENISKTMTYVYEGINKHMQIIAFQQMLQRGLQVYILENYLEIDIGYATIDKVTARRGRWKIIFDKIGSIEDDMKKSWEQNSKGNRGKTHYVNMDEKLSEYAGDIWHYLFGAALAIKRKEFWRGIGEMDIARNMLIEIKGLRLSLEAKRYRDVDNFPSADLSAVHKTIPSCLSQEKLTENLYCLVGAIYDELEMHYEKFIVIKRRQVEEYIDSIKLVRNL